MKQNKYSKMKKHIDAEERFCENEACGKPIPEEKLVRKNRKYCSDECRISQTKSNAEKKENEMRHHKVIRLARETEIDPMFTKRGIDS